MQETVWLVLLIVTRCHLVVSTESAKSEFLQTVITHLQNERKSQEQMALNRVSSLVNRAVGEPKPVHENPEASMESFKIVGPTPVPNHLDMVTPSKAVNAHLQELIDAPTIPPPPLSKEELVALYEAAINKGSSLMNTMSNNQHVAEGLHQLQNLLTFGPTKSGTHPSIPGYYYYFYPIKELKNKQEQEKKPEPVKMVPPTMMVMDAGEKNVEPLFMAVAGFIGMALIFAASVLFLPKFGSLRSRGISVLKNAPDELAALTKLVLEAIDGKDCSERIVCEVGRAFRNMKLDNKPIRILEILLPPDLGKQLQQIRKAASKKLKCNFIPCKWRNENRI